MSAQSRRHREPRATVPFLTTKAFFQLKGTSRARQGTSPAHRGRSEAGPAAAGNPGYGAVNVVDLASKASVTTGALYHHFGSKLGLYLTVREPAADVLAAAWRAALLAVATGASSTAARASLVYVLDPSR